MNPALLCLFVAAAAGGEPQRPHTLPLGDAPPPVPYPAPTEAYCSITVDGLGPRDMETDYVPHVVNCENGGANLEALKAQAIAARSVAYYAILNAGSICDSQSCQVYSCGKAPSALALQAAEETSGVILSYDNILTYGFYVAGDSGVTPPACVGVDGSTEQWVTYNEGKTGTDVEQTALGFQHPVGDPNYGQNRGCMAQWGARCLENNNGYNYLDILKFFYGDDINLRQTTGPCVTPVTNPPMGALDASDCAQIRGWAQDPDTPETPLEIRISFGGPEGEPGVTTVTTTADEYRMDLCDALGSCEHGFSLETPLSLQDEAAHTVHVVAVDSSGGTNAEVGASPGQFTCPRPAIPPGVRRQIPDPNALTAWGFDPFLQQANVDEPTLQAIAEGSVLGSEPELVSDDGGATLWLLDEGYRRSVSAAAAAIWGFATPASIESAELLSYPEGTPLREAIFLVKGPNDPVYLMDDDQLTGETSGTSGGTTSTGSGTESSGATSDDADTSFPGGYGQDGDTGCGCRHQRRRGPLALTWLAAFGLVRRRREGSRDRRVG